LDNLRRSLEMNPTAEETHRLLGLVYMAQGLYDDAAASFREAMASSDYDVMAFAGTGHVAARRGRLDEAGAVLHELHERSKTRYVSPVALCGLYAALGQADAAFEWLEQAYRERRGWLAYLKIEPMLDGLRNDPRFPRLVERMRLT
jgi:tetratricopeptide (TPR) repeat protein